MKGVLVVKNNLTSVLFLFCFVTTGFAQNQYTAPAQDSWPYSCHLMSAQTDSLKTASPLVQNLNNLITIYISDAWHILSSPARFTKKSARVTGAIVLTGGLLYAFDQQILAGFHRRRTNLIYDAIMDTGEFAEPMGQIEKMNPYCLAGYTVGYLTGFEPLQEASIQIIESLSIASGIKQLVRDAVGRTRPSENKGAYFYKFARGESFPSGHTSNAFQVATILSHHFDYLPVTILNYSLATAVALWRIDENLHWPADVFFGAVYGTAVSSALLRFHRRRNIHIVPVRFSENNLIGFKMAYHF